MIEKEKCEFCGELYPVDSMKRKHNLKGFYYVCWPCQQKGSSQVDTFKIKSALALNRKKLNKTK